MALLALGVLVVLAMVGSVTVALLLGRWLGLWN
jgi:hypothetical protein